MSINIEAALLKKLQTMTLRARYIAEGYVSGLHQSPLKGSSLEFAQHRQYVPGDEFRNLDWKVYGRTNRFYVKQYQEETNIRCYNVIDRSKSMGFSSGELTKLEYASYFCAALTYLLISQGDSAGLISYSRGYDDIIPPRNFRAHMHFIMDRLENLNPSGKTDFEKPFYKIGKLIKKRSLLIVFSDLLDDPDKVIKSLKYFPYLKNDLIVIQILDPAELKLEEHGEVEFVDMETGERLKTRPDVIKKEYKKKMEAFLEKLERGLKAHSIDYYRFTTDMYIDRALSRFIEGRKRFNL